MVKSKKSNFRKNRNPKEFSPNGAKAKKINASTVYDTCSEQLSPFGGLLPLIKFLDLVEFRKIFDFAYKPPTRKPKLGHYSMVVGLLMLLFIGFNRIWHFSYIRLDAMLCGFFKLTRLPVARKDRGVAKGPRGRVFILDRLGCSVKNEDLTPAVCIS